MICGGALHAAVYHGAVAGGGGVQGVREDACVASVLRWAEVPGGQKSVRDLKRWHYAPSWQVERPGLCS